MGSDPRALDELQKALNDTARSTAVLWIAFITFLLYLAIAFGSVTHRDLLLASQVKLPVLNTDLPLVGFFVVAPVLLTVFHFYILLQLHALGAKADGYNKLLAQEAPIASEREYLRQRLDPFFFSNCFQVQVI
jgi:hypothetical protein